MRSTEGSLVCMPVVGSAGLLGYLWASGSEGAMSFQPYWPEDAGYAAGLVWVDRISSAHANGMTPLEALESMANYPDDPVSGRAVLEQSRELSGISELYDLAVPEFYLNN